MLHLISNQHGRAVWGAATFLSWTGGVWVRIPLETYIFILNFSLPPRSEQVNGAVANEINHVHSPEVIVVLDPRYDLSYKALYISTCSIALSVKHTTCTNSQVCFVSGVNNFFLMYEYYARISERTKIVSGISGHFISFYIMYVFEGKIHFNIFRKNFNKCNVWLS